MLDIYFPYKHDTKSPTMTVYRRAEALASVHEDTRIYSTPSYLRFPNLAMRPVSMLRNGLRLAQWSAHQLLRKRTSWLMDATFLNTHALPAMLLKTRKVIADWGDVPVQYWQTENKKKADFLREFGLKQLLTNADLCVPRGHCLVPITEEILDTTLNTTRPVYDPVESHYFNCQAVRARVKRGLKQRYGINHVIGYVGGIRPHWHNKRVLGRAQELMDAYALLPEGVREETLLAFIGSGAGYPALEDHKHSFPKEVQKNILLTGNVTDTELKEYLPAFDVGYMEAYNTLGYHAMVGYKCEMYFALGIPVITPAIGERKLWRRFIKPIEPIEPDYSNYDQEYFHRLSDALLTCLTMKEHGITNQKAREFALKTFSESVIRNRFKEVLDAL